MGVINLDYQMVRLGRFKHLALSLDAFKDFNSGVLGLGQISKEGEHLDALAAIFDLEGFTAFCNQMDPHLVVPEYLEQLLRWMFLTISSSFTKEIKGNTVVLWGKFPFFAKFLGDGILFLWDTRGLGPSSLGNIVVNLYKACRAYPTDFVPEASKTFGSVPARIRCGIARGQVIAIGGGRDFVGPCVNVASRLQKVGQLAFAFSQKGFKREECFGQLWRDKFIVKRIPIRGVSQDELIHICADEFAALPPEEKAFFQDP